MVLQCIIEAERFVALVAHVRNGRRRDGRAPDAFDVIVIVQVVLVVVVKRIIIIASVAIIVQQVVVFVAVVQLCK